MTTPAQRAAKTICHALGATGRNHAPVAEIIQREFQQQTDALAEIASGEGREEHRDHEHREYTREEMMRIAQQAIDKINAP